MSNYLVSDALSKVWCTPDQDNQAIFKLARITPRYGVQNNWKIFFTNFTLPVRGVRFDIYQIGQVYPVLIDLFPKDTQWTTLAESCNLSKTICNVYLSNGIEFPRTETWYMVAEEGTVFIAIKQNSKIPFDSFTQDVYFRVYRNAYFNSLRSDQLNDFIEIRGGTMISTEDITTLQTQYNTRAAAPGSVYTLCNGFKIDRVALTLVSIGDVVEYVYDSSILAVVDLPISSLDTFDSDLDLKGKYLLRTNTSLPNSINYQDDIDVFIINSTTKKGLYYHKNTIDALRSLTHRDYSTSVGNVAAFLSTYSNILNGTSSLIRLHIRKSGYSRSLVNEHHRIKELYKLSYTLINEAMIGVDSTVPVWTATALESSDYIKVMGSKYRDITPTLVKNAYGYNAVTKLAGDTPVKTTIFNGQTVATIPYLFTNNSTVFEYDANGLLINWYVHPVGEVYNTFNPNCAYIENVVGVFSDIVDDKYNVSSATLDPNLDYRFYTSPNTGPLSSRVWTDVTGGGPYTLVNNLFTWVPNPALNTLIRSNKTPLISRIFCPTTTGVISFNLVQMMNLNGTLSVEIMRVPMGELTVWLNGKTLIEGLDYFVEFPLINIVNKEYLVNAGTTDQDVVYRFTGLAKPDLTRYNDLDFGFVVNGYLSVNHRFNIRDDKVVMIVADGRIYTKDDLLFSEDSQNYTFVNNLNGKPYIVKDTIVPVKSLALEDTYSYREKSKVVDKTISDYLTVKLPEVSPSTANPIIDYYKLYSPFICKIIFDLKNLVLNSPVLKQQYNDDKIRELVEPYLPLLTSDPIYPDNAFNKEYIIVHPHYLNTIITLDIYQYTFLNRVVGLYARGLVNITSHVALV